VIQDEPVVLVVDDTTETRRLIRRVLERDRIHVIEAANAHDAMPVVVASRPDAIVLDMHMPGMSGLELARAIRDGLDPRTRSIPILACSASVQADAQREALEAGCNDFCGKPFDVATFAGRVRALLPRAEVVDSHT
jgi:CheY-like chemotaxis protein